MPRRSKIVRENGELRELVHRLRTGLRLQEKLYNRKLAALHGVITRLKRQSHYDPTEP